MKRFESVTPTSVIPAFAGMTFLFVFILGTVSSEAGAFFLRKPTEEQLQRKISRVKGDKSQLYSDLGTLRYKRGRMEEAAEDFEKALQEEPSRKLKKHIYLYLGKSYESSHQIEKAIAAYEQAAKRDKKNWRRHRDLARLYDRVKLYRQAIQAYQMALKRNPENPVLYFEMGHIWRKKGIYISAEHHLVQAKELGYDHPNLYEELSLVYEGQGRFQEAATSYEKLVNQFSPLPVLGRLITLSALAGNFDFANRGLERLRNKENVTDTFHFYEAMVELLGQPPDRRLGQLKSDSVLEPLLDTIQPQTQVP